jgi:hypothetical protein
MSYAAFCGNNFTLSLFRRQGKRRKREPAVEAMLEGKIAQGASLAEFLIFCKNLSSDLFPFGCLNPKAAHLSPPKTCRSICFTADGSSKRNVTGRVTTARA